MIFIVGTLAFTSIESRNIPCTDIEVVYDNEELINIDKDKLIRIVKNTDGKILKKVKIMNQFKSSLNLVSFHLFVFCFSFQLTNKKQMKMI